MYFYFTKPCHENLPESPLLLSVMISPGALNAQVATSDSFNNPAPHRVSGHRHSLQQAEEFPVVLITFSFGHQAVQLINQLSFHLEEEAIGHSLAAHVKDELQTLGRLEEYFISQPWGCPLLYASDLFLLGSVKWAQSSYFSVKQD